MFFKSLIGIANLGLINYIYKKMWYSQKVPTDATTLPSSSSSLCLPPPPRRPPPSPGRLTQAGERTLHNFLFNCSSMTSTWRQSAPSPSPPWLLLSCLGSRPGWCPAAWPRGYIQNLFLDWWLTFRWRLLRVELCRNWWDKALRGRWKNLCTLGSTSPLLNNRN